MNLKDVSIAERKKLVSHWPILIIGSPGSGKTRAIENMSAEDKKRTIVINMDTKNIGNGEEGEFAAVFSVSSNKDMLEARLQSIPDDQKEYKEHFLKVLKSSYFINDPESIDKLVNHIIKASFSPNIDRIVLDTFKSLDVFCEEWGQMNAPDSRAGWGMYGTALSKVMQALKEASILGLKFVYVYGHHIEVPASAYDNTPKKMPDVKGNIMKGAVESNFNTIVYMHRDIDGNILFESDVNNTNDTSRNKLVSGSFKFKRKSLDDLEQYLNSKATINENLELEPVK